MQSFIQTIINAIQAWTKKEIKKNINITLPTPDWNENDSNADGYIENRTHWEEINSDILVPPTTVIIGRDLFVEEAIDVKLITGQLYNIVWEEKEYQCVCYDYDECPVIGNNACWGGNNGNGEPFLISNYDGLTAINVYTPGTYTISVFTLETIIHKLDPKYLDLPDNIATTDEVQKALDVANTAQSAAETVQATVNTKMDATNPVGTGSFSMNRKSETTIGNYSHAEGYNTTASNTYSHAEGNSTTASGYSSHAEGNYTTASGSYSHAEGSQTIALGQTSHAEGIGTIASRVSSHVSGRYNIPDSNYTIGSDTFSTNKTHRLVFQKSSSFYLATDYEISADGDLFVLKNPILVNGSTLSTQYNTYKGYYVLFKRDSSTLSPLLHEFVKDESSGQYIYQLAGGASYYNQYLAEVINPNLTENVLYVVPENTYAHIVGNGTSDTKRSNAHTLDWNGNAWYQGDVFVGGTSQDDGEVLAKMSEVIPAPTTATVGQTIAVKAVDENGKPTEWEAVDVSIDGYATTQQLKQVEDKIPDQLADLQSDASHRTVTDSEKQNWNNKSNFSGNYNDLQNKPTIPTVPTNVSAFSNDKGYITKSDIPSSLPASDVYSWAKQPNKPSYTKSEVGLGNVDNVKQYSANNPPPYPVTSVNGQTGAVDVEPKGTAASAVSTHNTNTDAHNDIRLLIEGLTTRLNTLADSDDTTLDQLSEVVEYIKDNRELIEGVTTNKISVADIIDNLTTSVTNKPLSAKQGVALKALIDAIKMPTKLSELTADSTHRTVTDSEKNTWNAKSNFSGSYDDLTNKPTIPQVPANVSAFTNDAGYMKTSEQQTVIDTALAQAKASGKFDGKDGRSIFIATSPAVENPDDENIYEFNTSAINTNGRNTQVDDLIIYLGTSQEFKLYQVVSIISGYVRCLYLGKLKGDNGEDGQRGFSILKVTTAPSSYTTATGGFTPTYRIALSTVKSQSKATEVLVGDTLAYNYYQYPVGYVDGSYVYVGARTSIRGATGAAYTLNDTDKATIVAAVKDSLTTEEWTFTLKDGTTVTKAVLLG